MKQFPTHSEYCHKTSQFTNVTEDVSDSKNAQINGNSNVGNFHQYPGKYTQFFCADQYMIYIFIYIIYS